MRSNDFIMAKFIALERQEFVKTYVIIICDFYVSRNKNRQAKKTENFHTKKSRKDMLNLGSNHKPNLGRPKHFDAV